MMDEQAYAALTRAIENFRPERSLQTKEDFDQFYVPRPISPLAELGEQIRIASQEAKFLVYGHRGSGKTSELNHLSMELEASHFTVVLSLENENDLSDLHYTELLTALCRALIYEASRRELEVSRQLLDDVLNWFSKVEDVTTRQLSAEGGATQKVGVYFLELFAQQKALFSKREERRRNREQREGELLSLINRLIEEVQQADAEKSGGERALFVVIDSLDRCSLDTVKKVFAYTEALCAPRLKMVYTVPLAFSRDKQFNDVMQDFGNYHCGIPILTLYKQDGQRDEAMWSLGEAIIWLRCDRSLMPDSVCQALIAASGGVLRILFTLFYNACALARTRQLPQLSDTIAAQVRREYQERFYLQLREEDYQTLSQPFPNRYPKIDEQFLALVYANCILQHTTDGKSWYDLHPLVRELVDEWRAARASETTEGQP